MPLSFWPNIRINSWGGLGSQFFSLVVAQRLQVRYPFRNIKVVFHSSGVTKRNPEINKVLIPKIETEFYDDFREEEFQVSDSKKSKNWLLELIHKTIKKLFIQMKFMSEVSSEEEFRKIAPWIVSTRGHYTNIELTEEDLNFIEEIAGTAQLPHRLIRHEVALHYRLGDLVYLSSKTYLDSKLIGKVLSDCLQPSSRITVYTDSKVDEVPREIQKAFTRYAGTIKNFEVLETIHKCVMAETFIGTNSKISLWIAILRLRKSNQATTYLPNSIANQYRRLTINIDRKPIINSY